VSRPPLSTALAGLAAFSIAVGVACALHWPLPLALGSWQSVAAFHDGHVWCFDYIAKMVTGEVGWSHLTRVIGYPELVELRFITWLPALVALPLRPLLGPLGAYYAVVLASPGFVALATWALIRRLTRSGPWTAAGASLVFALCPYLLGALASGQTAKIQLWIVPLYLLALLALVREGSSVEQRVGAALALSVVTVAASFTSPTTTLQIPLVAGAWVLGEMVRGRRRFWAAGLLCLLALSITATSLLPARSYYASLRGSRLVQAFEPGVPPSPGVIPDPAPMAQPQHVLEGRFVFDDNPKMTTHLTYLGWPVLGICVLLTLRRFPGRWFAWGGVLLGVGIAFGPKLAAHGRYVQNADGYEYALPAKLLELAHYPMSESGMYYRAISLASLGFAVLVGGACGRIRRPWGAVLSWGLAAGIVYDGYRVSEPLWPRPAQPLPGLAAYAAMAQDPVEGRVLDLPLETDVHGGEVALLGAVFHGRATQALPRQNRAMQLPHLRQVGQHVKQALAASDPAAARATLAQHGYRYAIWHAESQNDWMPLDQVVAALGPPVEQDGLSYWVLE